MTRKLELLSMQELHAVAKDTSVPKLLRHQALELLNRRERTYYRHCYTYSSGKVRVMNYADDL